MPDVQYSAKKYSQVRASPHAFIRLTVPPRKMRRRRKVPTVSRSSQTLLEAVGPFKFRPGRHCSPFQPTLIEPRQLRSGDSGHGDLYAIAGGHHANDATMDVMITSSLSKSHLFQTSTSSDFALKHAENTKFTKVLRNLEPLHLLAT